MAYAFDDNGSLQKTGRASFLGSSVSPIIELWRGRPTNSRLGSSVSMVTNEAKHRGTTQSGHLDASLTPQPPTLTRP